MTGQCYPINVLHSLGRTILAQSDSLLVDQRSVAAGLPRTVTGAIRSVRPHAERAARARSRSAKSPRCNSPATTNAASTNRVRARVLAVVVLGQVVARCRTRADRSAAT